MHRSDSAPPVDWAGGVIAASCRVPNRRSGLVSRDDLVKRLIDTPPGHTIAVNALAGYGKTTTMLLWDEADHRPFAWVGLGPLDDDPVHLLRHIAFAFDSLDPLDADTRSLFARPGAVADIDLLPALGRVFEDRGPCVLVLDDTHNVRMPEALACLEGLLTWVPQGCHVALVGRSIPDVHLERMRMSHGVLELTATDLAMNDREAALVFDHAGLPLDEEDIETLVERTEGWPGGLHLAALALAGSDRPDGASAEWAFAADNRLVADYLVDEVLAVQPPGTAAFLEHSAVLDRMHAQLLDELLDASDSGRLLSELERSGNVFLIPIDGENGWYRYHHLFAEVLRERLRTNDPPVARRLEQKASALLESRGDIDGAIRHAVSAGDTGRAADLILCQTLPLINYGRTGLLSQWLDLLGPGAATRHPAAAVAWAYYGHVTGDIELMKRAAADAEASDWKGPLADGSPSLAVALATLRALTAWHGVEGVLRDAQFVRDAGPPPDNPWWGLATLLQGTVYSMLGNFDSAHERLMEALETTTQAPVQEAATRAHLALLALYDDDPTGADRFASQAMNLVERENLQRVLNTVVVFPICALVAARAGRHDEARRLAAEGREMAVRIDYQSPRSALFIHLLLAKTALCLGDRPQGRTSLQDAERAQRRERSAGFLNEQLDELRRMLDTGDDGPSLDVPPVTAAELRVLTYLPTHLSLREIAETLFISRNTAKSHSVAIYRKLGVSSRSDAVSEARRLGILSS